MKMTCKRFLVTGIFLHVISNLVLGLERFSPLQINTDADAQIAACHFIKKPEPTPEIIAICGFKGESRLIAVQKNQSKAHVQKDVKCDCLEQVFPYVDRAYHNIPGKLLLKRKHSSSIHNACFSDLGGGLTT